MTTLSICHFNDVYRVTPQKISPTSSDTIDVTQFAALLDDIRDRWPQRSDGKRDGESSSTYFHPINYEHNFHLRSRLVFGRCLLTFNYFECIQRQSFRRCTRSDVTRHAFEAMTRYL